uniref:Reverse transcriptase Ty1/copia-type domain-containing protein n=1 Tax=Peronospora matthiolae TaxID=2874970 RepID=A0AAV1VBK9_9STRA
MRMAREAAASDQEDSAQISDVVIYIFERGPNNYGEALRDSRRETWKKTMHEVLTALEDNADAQGNLERLKARLIACGNEKVLGVDYSLTFTVDKSLSTVKVISALAATWKVPAKHGGFPNANYKADKEAHLDICLQVPQGMDIEYKALKSLGARRKNDIVLQLHQSLYGLEQAGRLWSQLLHTRLTEDGFEQCVADMCLYRKQDGEDVVVVGVYVDDFLATGTSVVAVDNFFASLGSLSI